VSRKARWGLGLGLALVFLTAWGLWRQRPRSAPPRLHSTASGSDGARAGAAVVTPTHPSNNSIGHQEPSGTPRSTIDGPGQGAPGRGQAGLDEVPVPDEDSRKQDLERVARELQRFKELEEEYRTEQSQRPTNIWAPVPDREPVAPNVHMGLAFVATHHSNEGRWRVLSNEQMLFFTVSLDPLPHGEVHDSLTSSEILSGFEFVACADGVTRPLESHVLGRACVTS